MNETRQTIRIDKWLWHARFFKTRSLAAKNVSAGHVRINSTKTDKPAAKIGQGDTLTFPQGQTIRVVEVIACGTRRGPAPEAQTLYLDRTPAQKTVLKNPRFDGKGRPSKKDRRSLDLSRKPPLE